MMSKLAPSLFNTDFNLDRQYIVKSEDPLFERCTLYCTPVPNDSEDIILHPVHSELSFFNSARLSDDGSLKVLDHRSRDTIETRIDGCIDITEHSGCIISPVNPETGRESDDWIQYILGTTQFKSKCERDSRVRIEEIEESEKNTKLYIEIEEVCDGKNTAKFYDVSNDLDIKYRKLPEYCWIKETYGDDINFFWVDGLDISKPLGIGVRGI